MFLLLLAVVILATGVLVSVKHDAPHSYVAAQRIVIGLMLAIMLSVVVYAAEIKQTSCNDLEKYSFLWYANFCFLDEQSS